MSEGEAGPYLPLASRSFISLANSIKKLGYEFEWITDASDFDKAEVRSLYADLAVLTL